MFRRSELIFILIFSFYLINTAYTEDLTIWGIVDTKIEVFIPKSAIDGASQRLNEANVKYEVITNDYQRMIDEENPPQEEIEYLQNQNGPKSATIGYFSDLSSF